MKKTRKKVVSLLLAIILFFSVTMVKTEAKVLDEYKPLIVKAVDVVEVVEEDTDIAAYVNSQKEEFELVRTGNWLLPIRLHFSKRLPLSQGL